MKKFLSLVMVLCCCLSLLAGCANNASTETTTEQTIPVVTGPEALDGKKIIFIGNSYTFYGRAVLDRGNTVLTQAERVNDQGFFYQLCKKNGIDVEVTNWTFGGHNIIDICGEVCTVDQGCKGEHHSLFLKDTYYDYVAIQCYSESKTYDGDLVEYLKFVTDFFRKANPNVRFIILVPHMAAEKKFKWIGDLDDAKANGFMICNWGQMLDDISNNRVAVPGATQEYKRSTFVVGRTEADGHHQNILAGYLTALMTYCAITGESAVGQDYSFCDDSTLHSSFDLENYREKYYVHAPETNFIEVFKSEADMKGLQQLIDEYLK